MSSETHRITLRPVGVELRCQHGAPLRDLLFEQGVEFPCGGNGQCRGCRVRVVEGHSTVNEAQRDLLTAAEIDAGWRLACQCPVEDELVLELRQWDASILIDETQFALTPQDGLGVAVDLGTTTLVAQLLDLQTGHVLAVRTSLNPQARYGADVMSRVQFAVAEHGQGELERVIRTEIAKLIRMLVAAAQVEQSSVGKVVLVGNTVMHHLFSGIDLEPLSHYPFEPMDDGLQTIPVAALGWPIADDASVRFLPCLGGFVGSDTLAGILATNLGCGEPLAVLIDLGTNGEIVIGNQDRLLCASTAAGPAFEGARIHSGMRASSGAIWKVGPGNGSLHCEVIGNIEPRGICGSGLVDAVAVGLDLGLILPTGRLTNGATELPLAPLVAVTQTDIRQLQLAKGAIAAGVRILLAQWGAAPEDVTRVYLAGAFGNYVDRTSASRIGLIDFALDRVQPAGNTALLGAKLALLLPPDDNGSFGSLIERTHHVSLNADPDFQNIYVEEMGFPDSARTR